MRTSTVAATLGALAMLGWIVWRGSPTTSLYVEDASPAHFEAAHPAEGQPTPPVPSAPG
jgi:hypothetical protein